MRGKRAKILRRVAEGMTPNVPERNIGKLRSGMKVHHDCTRRVYQELKQAWKRGAFHN